jgi:hypothetical protein
MPPMFPYPIPSFQPGIRVIAAITQSNPASITTTQNHLYLNGMTVRIDIPPGYGMQQMNQLFGEIIVTGNTTFIISIDSTLFDPFTIPANATQSAQSVPFAEDALQLSAAVQNLPPGVIL